MIYHIYKNESTNVKGYDVKYQIFTVLYLSTMLTIFRREGMIKTVYQQNKENLRIGQTSKQK